MSDPIVVKYYSAILKDPNRLDDVINGMLKDGWQLYGPTSVYIKGGDTHFFQALVQYKPADQLDVGSRVVRV